MKASASQFLKKEQIRHVRCFAETSWFCSHNSYKERLINSLSQMRKHKSRFLEKFTQCSYYVKKAVYVFNFKVSLHSNLPSIGCEPWEVYATKKIGNWGIKLFLNKYEHLMLHFGGSEMAEQVKVPATRCNNPSSIPRNDSVDRTISLLTSTCITHPLGPHTIDK